jgi:PQQ enzyme repeat domain protein
MECKEILGGTAFKSEAKDENLNESVSPKEQSVRICKTIWRLNLGVYFYTPVYLREGCFTLAPLVMADISMSLRRKVAK